MTDREVVADAYGRARAFLHDLRPYTRDDGVIRLRPDEDTDNPILITATKFFILHKLGVEITNELIDWAEAYHYVKSREIEPGLLHPEKSWSEQTISHDEINGAVCLSILHADRIYAYGVVENWVFNNRHLVSDAPKQWIGRFGYLVPYIRMRASKEVPFTEQVYYFFDLMRSAFTAKGETSGKCLRVLQSWHLKQMAWTPLMALAMIIFLVIMKLRYKDLGGLYAIYFPGHPFAKHTQGVSFL